MFTYIVPSILATDRLNTQIVEVLNHELIDKVILVTQNSVGKYDLTHEKLVNIIAEDDSFCNGKWNLGFDNVKDSEKIILATDDINFSTHIFNRVADLRLEDFGIIGMGTEFKSHISRPFGFGQLMFLKKENYTRIPEGIKHWYGDDWLFYQMSLLGKPNYTIDCRIETNLSESSRSEAVAQRIGKDTEWWELNNEPFKQFFWK